MVNHGSNTDCSAQSSHKPIYFLKAFFCENPQFLFFYSLIELLQYIYLGLYNLNANFTQLLVSNLEPRSGTVVARTNQTNLILCSKIARFKRV